MWAPAIGLCTQLSPRNAGGSYIEETMGSAECSGAVQNDCTGGN